MRSPRVASDWVTTISTHLWYEHATSARNFLVSLNEFRHAITGARGAPFLSFLGSRDCGKEDGEKD